MIDKEKRKRDDFRIGITGPETSVQIGPFG
jgi:hypothetical protein